MAPQPSSTRQPATAAVARGGGGSSASGAAWPRAEHYYGLDTIWQLPEGKTKGLLFVAHGCNHQAADFFPPSLRCPACLGLPEESAVRATALQRGYAVVAVSSFNRDLKCWRNSGLPHFSDDLMRVPRVLRRVLREEGLSQKLPMYVFGASSGGGFVLRLAGVMPEVVGVIAQIVPAREELLHTWDVVERVNGRLISLNSSRPYPPVLFVHMAVRQPDWAETIQGTLQYCREVGIPADEIQVDPQPVTVQFLQRSPLINASLAEVLVRTLQAGNFTDEAGNLLEDPARGNGRFWRRALTPVAGGLDLERDTSHVNQLLNVAWAKHELTAGSVDTCLTWLEAGGKISIASLMQQRRGWRGI